MLNNMLGRPQLPYNPNQPNYALALGGHYAALASQTYPGLTPQGLQALGQGGQSQAYSAANPAAGGTATGGAENAQAGAQGSQQMNVQMFLRPQNPAMGQAGLLNQALGVGRQNVRPGQVPQMGGRPAYMPNQQQSVAQQLLSQQPIASHAMGLQVSRSQRTGIE